MVEDLKRVYDYKRFTESKIPELEFHSGAKVMLSHLANEEPEYLRERLRGYQADYIYLDEGTSYEFSTFTYLLSRNRGSSGIGGKFRLSCNPKRKHWLRKWLDWYIDADGYIDPQRDGVVRYFFIKNEKDANQVAWGDTKEEVYYQCKDRIDALLFKANSKGGDYNYNDFIKSFTFYSGNISDNKAMLDANPGYLASLASLGDTVSKQLLLGNWNVDESDYDEMAVSQEDIASIFNQRFNKTGDRCITADIALGGADNFLAMVWEGLHCVDLIALGKCSANEALSAIRRLQGNWDVPDSRVVFDGISIGEFIGGTYGMITNAVSFKANATAIGKSKHNYNSLKAQCADKLATLVKQGMVTISDKVHNCEYKNAHMKKAMSFKDVLTDDFRALKFETMNNGKLKLIPKAEQKDILGGRSPDILDNLIYLCYFYLDYTSEEWANEDAENTKYFKHSDEDLLDYLSGGGGW
jgi:hypothetical protein